MSLADLLALAESGALPACEGCPWSPQVAPSVGFGTSCTEHGLPWKIDVSATSMLVVQDPADTTPHQTGRLCAVHNAKNQSDRTAQQNLELWNATVSLRTNDPSAGGYLRKHYWTNSIMHGASAGTGLREKRVMKSARLHCAKVLEAQIRLLRPRVVIATGAEAVNSLHHIRLIPVEWSIARLQFAKGAFHHRNRTWLGDHPIDVYGTYHTASRVVNQTVAATYDPVNTERFIGEKTSEIRSPVSVNDFLATYNSPETRTPDRGMRFLLNHWIDIGVAIREAWQDAI